MVFCSNCGTENDKGAVFCAKCGKKLDRINRETKFVAVIIIFVAGFMGLTIYLALGFGIPEPFDLANQDKFYLPTVTGENVSAYKTSCNEIDFSIVTFEDDNYLNRKKIKVKGEIYGILENIDGRVNLQLKVPNLTRYPYIMVSYSTKIPYGVGDKVEVYGEYGGFSGFENYTVPSIKAAYIEKI